MKSEKFSVDAHGNSITYSNLKVHHSFETSKYLSVIELAIFLRVFKKDGITPCVQRIYNLVHQGKIPFHKPFGKLLFSKKDITRLIESSKQGGFKWK